MEGEYVEIVAGWHEAADGRGLTELKCCKKKLCHVEQDPGWMDALAPTNLRFLYQWYQQVQILIIYWLFFQTPKG